MATPATVSREAPLDARSAPPGAYRRDPALDGVRGVAILAVLLFHFTMFARSDSPPVAAALRVAGAGWTGVDLFFVLSGFLITGILLDTKGTPRFFRNFYARRALRILPLYYGVLAVAMAVLAWLPGRGSPALHALFDRQLWLWTFTTNWGDARAGAWVFNADGLWLNHFWSLAIEEQFYLVWPLIVFSLDRRRLAWFCVALVAIAAATLVALVAHGAPPLIVYSLTPCRIGTLAIGALAAIALRDAAVAAACRVWLPWAVAASVALLGGVVVRAHGLYWLDPHVHLIAFTPIAVLAGAAIGHLVRHPESRAAGWLRTPALRFFGRYSYAMYVFHYLLWPLLERHYPASRLAAATGSPAAGIAAHCALGVTATVAAALVSHHAWERHFLRWKDRFQPARAGETDAAVAAA